MPTDISGEIEGKRATIINPLAVTLGDSGSIDAFGRLRSASPETIFDSKQLFDNQPLFWDDQEVSGTGTGSTHSALSASTTMTVSETTAGKRVRQTFQRFNYQPGKSQLILMTGTLKTASSAGITRAIGYFDDDNGLFVQDDEGVIKFVKRSNITGTPVDTKVPQTEWNIDRLDGKGRSKYTLEPSASQIFFLDFEWLGVGRVRMGFVIDGKIIYCHEFNHANVESGVYMSTPNLPLRYEIENDGTGPASSLEHICSSVISEGGNQDLGVLHHLDSGGISGLSGGNTYAAIGIRLKSTRIGQNIKIENISAITTSGNDLAHWELRFNPTVAGTFTYSDEADSAVQKAIGTSANTVTDGIEIDGGYFSTAQSVTITVPNALKLGSAIDGTRDEIVLVIRPITNNITIQASLSWREL